MVEAPAAVEAPKEAGAETKPKFEHTTEDPANLTARGQKKGNVTILTFYAYVSPVWTKLQQDEAMEFCYNTLLKYECTGRLRVAREGFNGLLTGPPTGIRAFTEELKAW